VFPAPLAGGCVEKTGLIDGKTENVFENGDFIIDAQCDKTITMQKRYENILVFADKIRVHFL